MSVSDESATTPASNNSSSFANAAQQPPEILGTGALIALPALLLAINAVMDFFDVIGVSGLEAKYKIGYTLVTVGVLALCAGIAYAAYRFWLGDARSRYFTYVATAAVAAHYLIAGDDDVWTLLSMLSLLAATALLLAIPKVKAHTGVGEPTSAADLILLLAAAVSALWGVGFLVMYVGESGTGKTTAAAIILIVAAGVALYFRNKDLNDAQQRLAFSIFAVAVFIVGLALSKEMYAVPSVLLLGVAGLLWAKEVKISATRTTDSSPSA